MGCGFVGSMGYDIMGYDIYAGGDMWAQKRRGHLFLCIYNGILYSLPENRLDGVLQQEGNGKEGEWEGGRKGRGKGKGLNIRE